MNDISLHYFCLIENEIIQFWSYLLVYCRFPVTRLVFLVLVLGLCHKNTLKS